MSDIIWEEIIPSKLWQHKTCDVQIRNVDGKMFFYDKSKMDVMFPLSDLLDSPAIALLSQITNNENKIATLRRDVDFLFGNQSAQIIEVCAQVDLMKYQLATMDGLVANNRGIYSQFKAEGFVIENKNAGEIVKIQRTGIIENPEWNWSKGQTIFCYSNTISKYSTLPDSKFIQKVAEAITPNKLLITIEEPYLIN